MAFWKVNLRHTIRQSIEHYNTERRHRARCNLPLSLARPPDDHSLSMRRGGVSQKRWNGSSKHYRWVA